MSAFSAIPLGRPIPDSPHAVSCSLPTMHAVRGYEERSPDVMDHIASGYPRFVVHAFSRRLADRVAAEAGLSGQRLWLVSSERMAEGLESHLEGSGAARVSFRGIWGVAHPESAPVSSRAKLYLQHVGGFISSREAEDHLVRLGLEAAARPEAQFAGDSGAEVRRRLAPAFPGLRPEELMLANSGMNAIHAAFRAVSEVQACRGRTAWVQLGWLYLDTIALLKKFTAGPGDYLHQRDVFDLGSLERLFASHPGRIAGLITEVPTNPLVQTPDVGALAALCRRHGVRLVLDPTVSSAFSVEVMPHADVVVTSLTKYAGNEGDIIAGLAAVNPAGADAPALRAGIAAHLESPYPRDLARLASQIGKASEVLARIEESTPRVAQFLSGHPGVREVFWAQAPASWEIYARIARLPGSVGGMISFSLKGPLEPFYDRLRLPKGPSFGMRTTLICPFMYLAHYDLVTTPEGRAELAASGLDPELLRLCVGAESGGDIIAALDEALA